MDKNIYYLVVEARPKEFMPIDINILLKSNMNFSGIEIIDSFTKEYTYDELMNMIIQNNLLPNSFLNGKLYVINDKKFRFKVLTKDDNLLLDDFFINNIEASFVIGKLDKDTIGISARSLGNFNITRILESLGGGGDDYNGAARFEKTTISKVEQELKKAIAKEEGK